MSHIWDQSWEAIEILPPGGQGITKLVRDKRNPERQGVLKYLKNNQSPAARARMQREVASLQSLCALNCKVPNVLEHNTGSFQDLTVELYLVMELVSGLTLKDLVEKEGKRSVDQAAKFALSLCDTVRIAHSEGILHRDIKPDNIIVRDAATNDLFIVDYGLSFNKDDTALTQFAENFKNKFLDLPETNTPGGDRRDPRSDVTAVCAVFYYMLTGHVPGHLQDGSGKMPHLRPRFTVRDAIKDDARVSQVELILSRGLAPPLQSRFQNIDEFSERLTTLVSQSSITTESNPIATAMELSGRLREQDRKTQLGVFKPTANTLMNNFVIYVRGLANKLGRFHVSMNSQGRIPKVQNLDMLTPEHHINVSVEQHGDRMLRAYAVGSRGEQCVVVAFERSLGSNKNETPPGNWQELTWYEGKGDDQLTILRNEFQKWLDRVLPEIAADILSGDGK